MKRLAWIPILVFLMHAPIGEVVARTTCFASDISEFYSFENDMQGWSTSGADLNLDEWSITRSQEMATDGLTAVRFDLANNNDRGKIWIEKPFLVEPNRLYEVNVSYSFASEDGLGPFDIITGVLKQRPVSTDDLIPAFRESTGKGSAKPGYRWQDKEYRFTFSSGQTTSLWLVIGISGNFEIRRVYYVDSVRVEITPKPEGALFYSFENDMEGLTANATDVAPGDWSITRSAEFWDDGATSLKLDLNNTSGKGKVWITGSFEVVPGNKYRVSLDYAFSSRNAADFRLIAAVFRSPPQTGDDLSSAIQDEATILSPLWVHKSYDFTIKSKKSSTVYVVIGVEGTAQTHREYFIDSVCVTLTPK
jgi:hypothetical protein